MIMGVLLYKCTLSDPRLDRQSDGFSLNFTGPVPYTKIFISGLNIEMFLRVGQTWMKTKFLIDHQVMQTLYFKWAGRWFLIGVTCYLDPLNQSQFKLPSLVLYGLNNFQFVSV